MARRNRVVLITVAVVALIIGSELGLNALRGPEGCVQVQNLGDTPVENLVVTCGDSRSEFPRIEPGASVNVFIQGDRARNLNLRFSQKGNALGSYQHQGFNPALMQSEGSKLVLKLRPNEVERFESESDPATPLGRATRDLWNRFLNALGVEPDYTSEP